MENFVYTILVVIFYWSSCTILLPLTLLLMVSKTVQNFLFSFVFSSILGPILAPRFVKYRKNHFELLKEHLKKHKKTTSPLEVLEIGIGAGSNLEYYPENVNLTALDMNESFVKYFQENAKKYPGINYKNTVLGFAEDMSEIPDQTFDVVISTHVLCSVKDVEAVLNEVKRVLKPGGIFHFMEHSAFSSNDFKFMIQKVMAPLWKLYCDGCNLDRNLGGYINKAGFSEISLDKKYPSELFLFFRPHIFGLATK